MPDLLDGVEPPVTMKDLINCATREVALRKQVYPRMVTQGRMQAKTALIETKRMEAILMLLGHLDPLLEAARVVCAAALLKAWAVTPEGEEPAQFVSIDRYYTERLAEALSATGLAEADVPGTNDRRTPNAR